MFREFIKAWACPGLVDTRPQVNLATTLPPRLGYNCGAELEMKEKEIRERIERFLKRTAQTVVVPTTMGLGLSLSGCDGHSLRAGSADGGADTSAQVSDAATTPSDTALTLDLPPIYPPYLMISDMPDSAPEAKPDVESEAGPGTLDAGSDRRDTSADISAPLPPYLGPGQPFPGQPLYMVSFPPTVVDAAAEAPLPQPMPAYLYSLEPGRPALDKAAARPVFPKEEE